MSWNLHQHLGLNKAEPRDKSMRVTILYVLIPPPGFERRCCFGGMADGLLNGAASELP